MSLQYPYFWLHHKKLIFPKQTPLANFPCSPYGAYFSSWMEMSVSRCSTNAGNTTAFPIPEDLGFLDFSTFQVVLAVKNPPANYKRHRFNPWVGKISWRRNWQPTLVFLPGEFHGQRSLASYSPQGHRVRHDWVCMHHHRNQVRVHFLLLWLSNHDVQTLPWHPNPAMNHQPYLPSIWQMARQPPCLTPNSGSCICLLRPQI